jgi:transposase
MRANSRLIPLTSSERSALSDLVRLSQTPANIAQRARMILLVADGVNQQEVGRCLHCSPRSVSKWLNRWDLGGIDALRDEERSGRPLEWTEADIQLVVSTVCTEPPSYLARWSVRTLANFLKMPPSTVHEVMQEHDLHPHRLRTFTFSPDPNFKDKLLEVVGLYMNPPENALVLCVDEKTGIQALDRTQPVNPLGPMKPRAWTNEYVRHGTKTLIASLDVASGEVYGHVTDRRTSKDFLHFMDGLARKYEGKRMCVIMDNLNTHKNAAAKEWLAQYPKISFHYTPTHASWTNLIECFFSIMTRQGLQQAVHQSKKELTHFLRHYIKEYNKRCGPFTWTSGPEKLRKIIKLTKRFQKSSKN